MGKPEEVTAETMSASSIAELKRNLRDDKQTAASVCALLAVEKVAKITYPDETDRDQAKRGGNTYFSYYLAQGGNELGDVLDEAAKIGMELQATLTADSAEWSVTTPPDKFKSKYDEVQEFKKLNGGELYS